MSSGRQPALWEALPALTLPILLIAGQQDPKFVGLASAMAAVLGQQMKLFPSATEVPVRLNLSTEWPQNILGTCSQVHQPIARDGGDASQTCASHDLGDAAAQSFAEAVTAAQPMLDTAGQCEQLMTGMSADREEDREIFHSEMRVQTVRSTVSNCRVLQGSGHACHVERPELVAAALACFMSSLASFHCSSPSGLLDIDLE